MAGEDAQLLLPRPPGAGVADRAARRRRARTRATTLAVALLFALTRPRCSRSPARCGRRRARRSSSRRAAGRSSPAWSRSCAVRRARQPRRRARAGCDAADPPHDYDWFGPSRVIPGTINEFPCVLVHCSATCTRTCWRCPFTLLALGVRAAGRAARAARAARGLARGAGGAGRRRSRSGRCTRSTRGRIPVAAGLLAAARRGLAARPGARERGASYALVWLALLVLARASCSCCRSCSTSTRRRDGIGLVHGAAPRSRLGSATGADLRAPRRPLVGAPTPARAGAPREAVARRRAGARRRAVVGGSLLAPVDDLAGVLVAGARGSRSRSARRCRRALTGAGALPVDADRRRAGAAADPRARLRARRVRRLATCTA